jgi:hypothetical protein
MEDIKIEETLLQEAKNILTDYNQLYYDLGRTRFEKLSLEKRLSEIELEEDKILDMFQEVREKENKIVATLNEKYGTGKLNLETGIYTSIK